ncbi:restriction endonuclease subunit S [Burkholderia pseudomallei]|nr:restriction endonuclease subunit S [Burkholderia pseudomallei]NVH69050.1 restriction endonuclease subunit S [Burkholderia pseudomallei]
MGIEKTEAFTFKDAPSRARRLVRHGDVIVSTVRTYLKAIAAIAMPPENLVVSTGFAVVRPLDSVEPRFAKYALQGATFIDEVISRSTGVSYPAINASDLARIALPVPPRGEQSAIAAFLDRETGKIDMLIAEQEKLLGLLAEKRQATISHAVTRGLNPDAPMKDSGVAWLGEVPANWAVKQLKHLACPGTAITYGIVQAGPHFEGGIPYIKTSDMAGDSLPLDGYALTSPEIDAAYTRSKVRTGDLVIAIRATVGKCLPVPRELDGANLTQGTAKVSPGDGVVPAFLLASLRSAAAQNYFESMAKGATFKEITLDALRRTPVLVPPLQEQSEIADFIDDEARKLDCLKAEVQRAIDLLKERRSALIAEAVTGKIDVRNAVPQELAA